MTRAEDQPLGQLLHQLAATLRPQVAAALGPLGLGLPEFVFLRIVAARPGCTSAELARATHVTAQAANQLLHRLEAMGAVQRSRTAASGRALPTHLTPDGKKLLARAERAVTSVDDHVLAGLTAAEHRQLKNLLGKAALHAAQHDAGCPPEGC